MSILEDLQKDEIWDKFLNDQNYERFDSEEAVITESIVRERKYRKIVGDICRKEYVFPIANKYQIPKRIDKNKMRDIYTFKYTGHYIDHVVVRVITSLFSRYSGMFPPNLYSAKNSDGVRGAVNSVMSINDIDSKMYYKTDISDYGNSIDIDILLQILREKIAPEDWDAVDVIYTILRNDKVRLVRKDGSAEIIADNHRGVMTGMPFAPFLSNVYLVEMDAYFYSKNVHYYRFIDDVMIVADAADLRQHVDMIHEFISKHNLSINPDKEYVYKPDEKFVFLGIQIEGNRSAISLEAIPPHKKKIKQYAKEYRRKVDAGQLSPYEAFVMMVGRHNNYFYGNERTKYCFSNLYFQMINTSENLDILDRYAQECIRYVYTGKFRASNKIKVPYVWLKDAGYIPLVTAYRVYRKGKIPNAKISCVRLPSDNGEGRVLRLRSR